MSVRGGWGRAYDRMSNQIWDSSYLNLPDFANLNVTVRDSVKPVFGLGASQTFPYNYPRPVGLDGGLEPDRRPDQRARQRHRRRSQHRADVSRQLVPGRAATAQRSRRDRGGLHRIDRPQCVSAEQRQSLQRRPAGWRLQRHHAGLCRGQLHRFERSKLVQRGDVRLQGQSRRSECEHVLHDRQGDGLFEFVQRGQPAGSVRAGQSGQGSGGLRRAAQAVGRGELADSGAGEGGAC